MHIDAKLICSAAVVLLLGAGCGGGEAGGTDDLAEHAIVYASGTDAQHADLWLLKPDGTDPFQLTDDPGLEFMATWSPDGDRVAYVAGASWDSPSDLYVLDLDGGQPERVSNTPGRCESAPTWTPDGEELVYVSGDCGSAPDGIFAVGLDGGEERLLVPHGSWPDVAADGRLLYTAPVPGKPWYVQRLWVSDLDGGNAHDVTPAGIDSASEATWSPDGGRVAFVVPTGDPTAERAEDWNEEVYVMNADGTDARRLTTAPGNDHWPPSWSPDGERLVYSADGDPASAELATVDVSTLEVTALTDDDAHDVLPAWRP